MIEKMSVISSSSSRKQESKVTWFCSKYFMRHTRSKDASNCNYFLTSSNDKFFSFSLLSSSLIRSFINSALFLD